MKTKLAIAFAILIAAVLFLAPACRRQSSGKRVIAVIPKGTSHFFWQSVHAGAESAAKEFGVELMWKGPEHENEAAEQINIVEDAINRRVDGIALAPIHKDALVPIGWPSARAFRLRSRFWHRHRGITFRTWLRTISGWRRPAEGSQ
jgi:ABC-type sugar transport system substrate-binding protein